MEEKAGNVTHLLVLFSFRYDGIYMRGTTSKMPQLIAGFGLLVFGLICRFLYHVEKKQCSLMLFNFEYFAAEPSSCCRAMTLFTEVNGYFRGQTVMSQIISLPNVGDMPICNKVAVPLQHLQQMGNQPF